MRQGEGRELGRGGEREQERDGQTGGQQENERQGNRTKGERKKGEREEWEKRRVGGSKGQ